MIPQSARIRRLPDKSKQLLWKTVRVWKSHSVHLSSMKINIHSHHHSYTRVQHGNHGPLLEADLATTVISPTLFAFHPWHQMARPRIKWRSPQESQSAKHRVHLVSNSIALGLWHQRDRRHMICMLKTVFLVSSRKKSTIMVLPESITNTSLKDGLQR